MFEEFEIQFFDLWNQYLIKTESLFITENLNYFAVFSKHFYSVCNEIIRLQADSTISSVSYIEYTMLYTNFINRRYIAEIWVYSDMYYLDKKQYMVGEYDISFLFVHFDELWERLISVRKLYVGKVSPKDIVKCMLQALPSFYSYLISIVRFSVKSYIDESPFTDIKKNDIFKLCVGGYMVKTEILYTLKEKKNVTALINRIKQQCDYKFTLEDCSGLDFSNCSFRHTNLRYAQFRNSILNNVNFHSGILIGTNFSTAKMEKCNLNYSTLYETDFSNANLKDASFRFAYGWTGSLNSKIWNQVGYLPTNFRNADLTNADFHEAVFKNADFRGAVLTNTDFTKTTLDKAIFSTRDLPLSSEQMSKIIIEEASGCATT